MIPSGGTGGGLKLVRHDQDTILAAVTGFSRFFGAGPVRCVGILPLHHVSGLMAWMRAAITGGTYLPWDWKRLEAGDRPVIPEGRWFISVVPTQLRRLMASGPAIDWLRGFHAVFVGGGPLWPDLADAAADAGLPISLSYGATETAAMAAALPPGEFLAGGRSCGVALPHAGIDLSPEGVVRVAGESIFRGYFPAWLPGEPGRPAETRPAGREFITGDLGAIDSGGRLQILGRVDHVIITGGKKADPLEIEAALLSTGEFSDVVVLGVPDPEWGESVVAFYPSSQKPPDQARIAAGLSAMPAHKRPRRYTAVPEWIRNAQGKVNRRALLEHIRRDPG
jgi:O-succinylbenzoic acid--CoA ligase